MGIGKISYSPSNLRSIKQPLVELVVPTIYFGMLPLPLVKGVQNSNSIGISGISSGNTSIVKTTSSPESSEGAGEGSINGIDFGRQQRGNTAIRHKRRRNGANGTANNKVISGNHKAKKKTKKVLLRLKNGKFTKKGA